MIEQAYVTEEVAVDVAHALFYENPKALYKGATL